MSGRPCLRCGGDWQSCMHAPRWRDELGTATTEELVRIRAEYELRQRFDPNFDLETERTI